MTSGSDSQFECDAAQGKEATHGLCHPPTAVKVLLRLGRMFQVSSTAWGEGGTIHDRLVRE